MNTLTAFFILVSTYPATTDVTRLFEQCNKTADQSELSLTSAFIDGSCVGRGQDGHVTSILRLIQILQWNHTNILFDQTHSHDLHLLLSSLKLTSTYDLSELHSHVEVKQLFQELHKTFFPRLHFLILSNFTSSIKLLKLVDQFDMEFNRSTDFRHHSYWMVACYSPCHVRTDLPSQISYLENVAMVTSETMDYPVLNQLLTMPGGRYFSSGRGVDQIQQKEDIFPNTRYGLNNRTLIVSTIIYDPYVIRTENGFEGYLIDVLNSIASFLNFSYEIVHPIGMKWGEIVDGTWDGMVGQLQLREVDLAVADLTMHEDREKVMDFLYPPHTVLNNDIMYTIHTDETESWKIFMKQFGPNVFLILSISLMVFTLMGYIVYIWDGVNTGKERNTHAWKDRLYILADVFFYMFGILIGRGRESNPRNQSARILLCTWGLFSVITATYYSANLVAAFAIQKPKLPFTSLAELVRQKEYKWGIIAGDIKEYIFLNIRSDDMKRAWEGVMEFNKTDSEVLSKDPSIHFAKVQTEKYAFISERDKIVRFASQHCDIRSVGEDIFQEQLAIGVPANYPLSRELEHVLFAIMESGLAEQWRQRWDNNNTNHCKEERKLITLAFQDIVSLFYLLSVGIGASVVVLVIEVIKQCLGKMKYS